MAKLNLPSVTLKQRRLDLRLTQSDLAARAGIEQSQVSKIERSLDVRLSTLMRLLTALDLDLLLVPRTRPGVATIHAGQPPHFDTPFQRPRTGTLLDRFAIPDDEDDAAPTPPRSRKQ